VQALADQLEQLVAGVVAEALVDDLEVVQVDQQQGAAPAVLARALQRLVDAFAEQQAVGRLVSGSWWAR